MERALAVITMAWRVRTRNSAFRTIVSMASVAATFAQALAKRARRRRKVARELTAYVVKFRRVTTRTTSAIRGRVTAQAAVRNLKCKAPMERRVRWQRSARRVGA